MSAKLMLISMGGLLPCYLVFEAFRNKVSSEIMENKLYVQAMEALRQHKGALYLLGQPITETKAKFNNYFWESEKTEIKVLLEGPKSKGILFISTKGDEEHNQSLNTVQLQIGSDDSKRLVIKCKPNLSFVQGSRGAVGCKT